MKSFRSLLVGICLLCLVAPPSAKSKTLPRLSPTQQALQANLIVVGRIVEIEEGDAEATAYQGASQKTGYKIANVKINEPLLGAKGITHIRVGFLPTNQPIPPQQVRLFDDEWGYRPDSYCINDEGCFFLQKHHDGDFYVPLQYGQRLDSKLQSYEGDLGKIKRMVAAFENPIDALKAKESEDRQFAANTLIHKYRTPPRSGQGVNKEVDISKEETNLILKVLGEMEQDGEQLTNFNTLLSVLQLTDRDGWIEPQSTDGVVNVKTKKEAFDKWYKEHGEKYRMKRWVTSKK